MERNHTRRAGLALILVSIATCVFLGSRVHAQTSGTGSFTIESTPATGGQVVPKLTWTTSPAGATCTATGDAAWAGTKAGSGTQTLTAAAPPRSYALRCTWPGGDSAALSWIAPTTNTDGTPLAKCATATDTGPCIAKYRLFRGASATTLSEARDHNFPTATSANWAGLTSGTHFFGIKTVTGQGAESALSNIVSKTVTAPMEWTASVGVKVPSPATGFAVE